MENQATSNAWLQLAKEAYDKSTSFVDNNYRRTWEDNLRHFQCRHHSGSKYYKASYQYRSKVFRPKTRAALRNNEAAAVAAFFANQDALNIEPMNPMDDAQKASAEVMRELVNYRLTHTIPWFLLCIGGLQDAMVTGVVCSMQDWEYEAKEIEVSAIGPADITGNPTITTQKRAKIIKDQPRIRLLPVENVRIAPTADWTDPIKSSPYAIVLWPMYVQDVMLRMEKVDPKTGAPKWKNLSPDQIRSGIKQNYDPTRQTRDINREDKYDTNTQHSDTMSDFDIVWCHENFMRIDGEEYVYWTLGTEYMLTDAVPLEDVYFHGERPLVMGLAVIETHKVYPESLTKIGSGIQQEINEIANSRLDNVKLVLNKRWFVKRGSQVDVKSLVRNVAGSVTLVNDTATDVRAEEFNDVTSSSYQEQDRLNVDYDELVGTFSASTIQTNRKLGETVGGMAMLRGGINALTEYLLRCYGETWAERVMKQLVKLEQAYETDQVILAIAANKAQLLQKYGIDEVTDELLNQELTTRVNVGMGATDPVGKVQQLGMGVDIVGRAAQTAQVVPLDIVEISKEVFGRLGFKDGERFIRQDQQGQQDPEKMQMQAMIQQLTQAVQELQAAANDKEADRQAKLTDTQIKQEGEDRRTKAQMETQLVMKHMDLMNPVAGEKPPAKKKAANE
ncbi:MAG: hypothetical protein ABFD97_20385 [Syntrophobacter sp.]